MFRNFLDPGVRVKNWLSGVFGYFPFGETIGVGDAMSLLSCCLKTVVMFDGIDNQVTSGYGLPDGAGHG